MSPSEEKRKIAEAQLNFKAHPSPPLSHHLPVSPRERFQQDTSTVLQGQVLGTVGISAGNLWGENKVLLFS